MNRYLAGFLGGLIGGFVRLGLERITSASNLTNVNMGDSWINGRSGGFDSRLDCPIGLLE